MSKINVIEVISRRDSYIRCGERFSLRARPFPADKEAVAAWPVAALGAAVLLAAADLAKLEADPVLTVRRAVLDTDNPGVRATAPAPIMATPVSPASDQPPATFQASPPAASPVEKGPDVPDLIQPLLDETVVAGFNPTKTALGDLAKAVREKLRDANAPFGKVTADEADATVTVTIADAEGDGQTELKAAIPSPEGSA